MLGPPREYIEREDRVVVRTTQDAQLRPADGRPTGWRGCAPSPGPSQPYSKDVITIRSPGGHLLKKSQDAHVIDRVRRSYTVSGRHGPGCYMTAQLLGARPGGSSSLDPASTAASGPPGIVEGFLQFLRRLVLPMFYEILVVKLGKRFADGFERFGIRAGSAGLLTGWH